MKKKMWIVIGIAALYFIYLPFSLFWSGIDKGNGMKRSVTLLKTVKKDLELHKIFARHGMKLTGDGASWRGKTCEIWFVVEDGTNARDSSGSRGVSVKQPRPRERLPYRSANQNSP